MANLPISGLTASASNLASTDLAPVVQTVGVGPVKMTGLQLAGGLLGSTTFNGSTVTTSSPVLNLTQTWNDGAVPFTGLKFNAAGSSDANSAAGSLLLDLQVGGTSAFNVTKAGGITFTGTSDYLGGPVIKAVGATAGIGYSTVGSYYTLHNGTTRVAVWGSSSPLSGSSGVLSIGVNCALGFGGENANAFITRPAAATLQLGAADTTGTTAPTAQFLRVQSWSSSTNNNQLGADFTIQGSRGTGTGAGGSIIFQVAPAGSSGTAQNAYATALTIGSDKNATFGGNITVAGGAISRVFSSGSGGTNFSILVNHIGLSAIFEGGAGNVSFGIGASGDTNFGAFVPLAASFGFYDFANTTPDTRLYRDTTGTLALRNGTNAQTFNVYGTYTASDNFERLAIQYGSSSDFVLRTEKGASGGSNRSLTFETYGAATFTIAAQTLSTSSDGFYSWSTTTSSRGSANTRLYRDADGVIGVRGSGATSPAAMSFYTYDASPPAAPAASIVRIYADTSGGKIRLMALFPSGAAQQIAIEP